jgi:prevent-host-death family protein
MTLKSVSSTVAKNKFGQVLADVTQNSVRYIVERHGAPKAIILSLDDFSRLLSDDVDRENIQQIISEVRPTYEIGRTLQVESSQNEAGER